MDAFGEKVSVNMNVSTLSSIDLLVDNGYYSNRSDFINQAVREALSRQQSTLDRIIENTAKKTDASSPWFIGVYCLTPNDVEQMAAQGEGAAISGYGLLIIDSKCEEEKLFSVLKEIHVRGKVKCSDSIKRHYGLKK